MWEKLYSFGKDLLTLKGQVEKNTADIKELRQDLKDLTSIAGVMFDRDRSQTYRWMHRLQPIIAVALATKMVLPVRKLNGIEELIERFPEVKEVMIDGAERPIQRPNEQKRQKQNYSGKKKRHSIAFLCSKTSRCD
jgi:hypothetical protein